MAKRRRKTLLQTTGYSVFPVLMVVEEEADGRTTFRPIPLEGAILLWWLMRWLLLLLAIWRQRLQDTTRTVVERASSWLTTQLERITLEYKMGAIVTRQLTLGILSG